MWPTAISIGAAATLFGAVLCQESGSYCDDLGRCFASYTNAESITWGFAIPETTEAPFDVILQVTAPIAIGWTGLGWGGSMTYNPLAVTWPNGDNAMIASRMAFGNSVPPPYDGSTYTLLEGSYVNDTHFVTTALCEGCSSWDPTGDSPTSLNPAGSQQFAFAYSTQPVNTPDDVDTTFTIHEGVGHWDQDLTGAQSADFEEWAGDAGGSPPNTTTTAGPVPTTSRTPTTLSTSVGPAPTQTTVAALPLPTSCGLEAAFPLEVAEGWTFIKVAGELTTPRGVVVDMQGNLLVVESGVGVTAHTFGSDGCIASSKTLISNPMLNHGITLSPDGATLVVSSATSAYRYPYDAAAQTVGTQEVVVKGMVTSGHVTRTVVIPPDTPNLLVVSHGSDGNIDGPTVDKATGRAIVKVFDMLSIPSGGYTYQTDGWFLGYGLRNEVAIVVDPSNMVWGVENSGDEFDRTVDGQVTDIHNDNPAEELNYLGDPSVSNEDWYGYPTCFTVWDGSVFPDTDFTTGAQFLPAPNSSYTDATCESESVPPRLTFQAHSAPLDGKFDADGSNLYVTLHGSWNRDTPTGFKVVEVPFTTGDAGFEPVAAQDSADGYNDILWDPQSACSSFTCFRPAGLVWDAAFTRMFVTSDNSGQGEAYLLAKTG